MNNRQNGRLVVRPLGWWTVVLDIIMLPLMYVILGTFKDSPQRTHRWNNHHLAQEDVIHLWYSKMVLVEGHQKESTGLQKILSRFPTWISSKLYGVLLHLTILGGEKEYVVIEPMFESGPGDWWHVGWRSADGSFAGISRIRLTGAVRLLTSTNSVYFFGVDSKGEQINVQVQENGRGIIGASSNEHRKIPLL